MGTICPGRRLYFELAASRYHGVQKVMCANYDVSEEINFAAFSQFPAPNAVVDSAFALAWSEIYAHQEELLIARRMISEPERCAVFSAVCGSLERC